MLAIIQMPWQHKANTSYAGSLYAALQVIGTGDASLAQRVHDDKRLQPFSASLHEGSLRIGTLTTDVFMAIAKSKFAHVADKIAACSFDDLLKNASAERRISLQFLTPTALGGFGNHTALPDPKWVFGSLVNRWRCFGGPEIPDLRYEETCAIYCNLRMDKAQIANYAQRGVAGTVTYLVPNDIACWYNALSDYAEFSGVGRKTTQGLGQTRHLGGII